MTNTASTHKNQGLNFSPKAWLLIVLAIVVGLAVFFIGKGAWDSHQVATPNTTPSVLKWASAKDLQNLDSLLVDIGYNKPIRDVSTDDFLCHGYRECIAWYEWLATNSPDQGTRDLANQSLSRLRLGMQDFINDYNSRTEKLDPESTGDHPRKLNEKGEEI